VKDACLIEGRMLRDCECKCDKRFYWKLYTEKMAPIFEVRGVTNKLGRRRESYCLDSEPYGGGEV
jgi:hypothetical protein